MNDFVLTVDCGEELANGTYCEFNGDVVAWEDNLMGTWGWTCPECGYTHEEDLVEPGAYDTIEEMLVDFD